MRDAVATAGDVAAAGCWIGTGVATRAGIAMGSVGTAVTDTTGRSWSPNATGAVVTAGASAEEDECVPTVWMGCLLETGGAAGVGTTAV